MANMIESEAKRRRIELLEERKKEIEDELQRYRQEQEEKEEKEQERESTVIRGFLPRLTPYQKAVAKMHGAAALEGINPDVSKDPKDKGPNYYRGEGAWGNRSFGADWHRVQGQPKSNMKRVHARRFTTWLRKLDQRCADNPSETFRYYPPTECKEDPECRTHTVRKGSGSSYSTNRGVRTLEDAVVQLQLLGVEVVA